MNWRLSLTNELMELIWTSNVDGLNFEDRSRLKELWEGLTDFGREQIQLWAETNDFEMPIYTGRD